MTIFSLNSNLYGDATWTGSEDKVFSNANNWTTNPSGANLYIGNDAADMTLGSSLSIENMYMGNGSTSADSSLTINNGGSLTGAKVYIGQDAKATLTIETGATLTTTGGLWTGNNSGSKGILNISGGSVTVGSACQIGNNGEGEVNVSGGELIYNGQIRIANQGKTGALNISGGNVSFNNRLYIGQRGVQKGSVTLSENGKMTVDQFLFVGGGTTRNVTLSDGSSLSLSGSDGSGILTLKGNSQLTVNGDTNSGGLFLGECVNNSTAYESKLDISGNAVLTVTGKEFMVASGGSTTTSKAKASINQTGGTINVNTNRMLIANATGSSATIDVSGGKLNIDMTGGGVWLGVRSTATINLSGTGVIDSNSDIFIGEGHSTSSKGIINQTGGTFNASSTNGILFGSTGTSATANQSTGTYNLSGGTLNATALQYGEKKAKTANFNVSGTGVANISGAVAVPTAVSGGTLNANSIDIPASGTLAVSGGSVNLGDGGITAAGTYTLTLSGGTLSTKNASWSSSLNATTSNTVTFSPEADQTITWSGVLSGSGNITKTGAGTLTLSNTSSSFTGDIIVNNGKLTVNAKPASSKKTSPLGNLTTSGRKIVINEGATLSMNVNNVFGENGDNAYISLDVDGGTLSNDTSFNKIYNLTFRNGSTLHVENGDATWQGVILFNNGDGDSTVNILKSETRNSTDPVRFTTSGKANANLSTRNAVFNVQDITNSANDGSVDNLSDLIVNVPLKRHSATYVCTMTKEGPGTMELTALNDNNGLTTINGGVLKLSGASSLGSGAVTNNATLEFAHDADKSFSNAISGTGAVVKSGSGTLTVSGSNYSYTGETTVSGGTLLVTSAGSLSTPKVTVASESAAAFQTGANLNGVAFELGEGGTFVVGETSTSSEITIGALTLSGGTISFDFNNSALVDSDGYNIDADWLTVSSANLNSGVIDLTFNSSSAEDWRDVIKNNYGDDGYVIITGSISDYENFNTNKNVQVAVNGTLSTDWTLTAKSSGLYLLAKADEPVSEPWYYANTDDVNLESWTIDGTDKQGVQFTEGGDSATFAGGVTMTGAGEFKVGTGQNLTLAGEVTGDGAVTKTDDGTLSLTNANSYTGGTTISAGTLVLSENGTLGTGAVVNNAALVFAHDSDLTFNNAVSGDGIVSKTGAGKLKIDATENLFQSSQFTVEAGELDFKGYFAGNIEVFNGSVFSPGNSVGEADITGNITFKNATGSNGVALFEFGEYADGADVNHDLFVMQNNGTFTADDGVILLDFANNDADSWAAEGNTYKLVSNGGFTNEQDYTSWLATTPDYSSLFKLTGGADGLYLVGIKAAPEPGSGVPEPSTWALMLLGAAGLLYVRKRTRK